MPTIAVPYPFVRCWYHERDEEGDYPVSSWSPGTFNLPDSQVQVEYVEGYAVSETTRGCHGRGHMLLTVVARRELPRPYQERVFYVRQWRDPEGKVFGNRGLRCCTARKFEQLARGYAYPVLTKDDPMATDKATVLAQQGD